MCKLFYQISLNLESEAKHRKVVIDQFLRVQHNGRTISSSDKLARINTRGWLSVQNVIQHLLLFSLPLSDSLNIKATVATVMPVASSTPFVLHLPANCQHDCVNTWGSYYCTCRQGYRLEADGKTCQGKNTDHGLLHYPSISTNSISVLVMPNRVKQTKFDFMVTVYCTKIITWTVFVTICT